MLLPFLVIWPFSNHEGETMKLPFIQNRKLALRSEVTMQVNNAFQNNIHWPTSHTNPNNATFLWVYYYNYWNDRQWLEKMEFSKKPSCIVCTRSCSSQNFMGTLYATRGRRRSGRSVLLMKAVKCCNYVVLVTD